MSLISARLEERETDWLLPAAAPSTLAIRCRKNRPSSIRTEFQRVRDRINRSTALRRMKGKTQVFSPPPGDHIRSRLTPTLELMQFARTVSYGFKLNEDSTEAIARSHTPGHTPSGHARDKTLAILFPSDLRVTNTSPTFLFDRVDKPIIQHPATYQPMAIPQKQGPEFVQHEYHEALVNLQVFPNETNQRRAADIVKCMTDRCARDPFFSFVFLTHDGA